MLSSISVDIIFLVWLVCTEWSLLLYLLCATKWNGEKCEHVKLSSYFWGFSSKNLILCGILSSSSISLWFFVFLYLPCSWTPRGFGAAFIFCVALCVVTEKVHVFRPAEIKPTCGRVSCPSAASRGKIIFLHPVGLIWLSVGVVWKGQY